MSAIGAVLAGLLTGILSGFGIGGGSLLLLYLTLIAGMEQVQAGGINLLYFMACAPAALYAHIRNGLVEGRAVVWCAGAGVVTAVAASLLASHMDTGWLRRGFGLFLLYVGWRELRAPEQKSGVMCSPNTAFRQIKRTERELCPFSLFEKVFAQQRASNRKWQQVAIFIKTRDRCVGFYTRGRRIVHKGRGSQSQKDRAKALSFLITWRSRWRGSRAPC